ncbi:YdaS family helix-turn-helix protein [Rhodanobacter sp. Si-c]|uniref:YdaS family helix-turn-helix protein n=1 Tax=Rhodanobacter lycopersici TaxID=3162487 RepID=A0ABV3QIU3_9GAMM
MTTTAQFLEARTFRLALAMNTRASGISGNDPLPVAFPSRRIAGIPAASPDGSLPTADPRPLSVAINDLPGRMQIICRMVGGATAIARHCGFSEGAVRNWCHGRSDISRERCIVLAQTFGISLRWLIVGEGPVKIPAREDAVPASASPPEPGEGAASTPPPPHTDPQDATGTASIASVDQTLLAAAMQLLQSYVGLVGGSLDLHQRADALVRLYHLLGHAGETGHATRMVAFHSVLNGYFCSRKSLIG